MVQEGLIDRIARGIYCKRVKTPSGDYVPSKDKLFTKSLIQDGDLVIGYETGFSLMNQIGLITAVPRRKSIATNNYNVPIPNDMEVKVIMPRIPITRDNYKYLQVLDVIDGMDSAPIDAAEPEEIIRQMIVKEDLLPDRLILYARRYYPTKALVKAIDITLGRLE